VNSEAEHRILVVDDERAIRDVVEVALVQAGFRVRTAVDGPDGLTAVRDWSPECILLDVMMPKIDGLTLLPLLRNLTEVPIIMLTARGDVRDRIDGLQAGADDYLAKPFDVAELVARVSTALRRPTLRSVHRLTFADLSVDLEERSVQRAGQDIDLSAREYAESDGQHERGEDGRREREARAKRDRNDAAHARARADHQRSRRT
jgi:two-component system response regulator MprA